MSKSCPNTSVLGWGDVVGCHGGATTTTTTTTLKAIDEIMTDTAAATCDRAGGSSFVLLNTSQAVPSMATTITPTHSRDGTEESSSPPPPSSFSSVLRGVSENVKLAEARIRDIEDRIGNHRLREPETKKRLVIGHGPQHLQNPAASLEVLENQLFAEKIRRIDALVVMGWEHYRWFLLAESSSTHETAAAAVRHIYEEALDASIELFCSSPPASVDASVNNERLMVLLLVLDFDEYCETLLEYELAREYLSFHPPTTEDHRHHSHERQAMQTAIDPAQRGPTFLRDLHDLWMTGAFDRFGDPSGREREDDLARVHAAGLCLVLFRKLESRVRPRTGTDLDAMERQFRYLFDEYLPKQLVQPSMNNIVATKHARVLFHAHDGSPTVYWSLLADSYRREWGEHNSSNHEDDDDDTSNCSCDDDNDDYDDSIGMDTEEDDEGL